MLIGKDGPLGIAVKELNDNFLDFFVGKVAVVYFERT